LEKSIVYMPILIKYSEIPKLPLDMIRHICYDDANSLENPNGYKLKTEGGIRDEIQLLQVIGSISGIWTHTTGCCGPHWDSPHHFVPEIEQ
jgi:hypothetical protein